MSRLVTALIPLLLIGCATTVSPPITADVRAMACHAEALAFAERAVPYVDTSRLATPQAKDWKDWTVWEIAAAPLFVVADITTVTVGAALIIATAPVSVPLHVSKVQKARREMYALEYASCMKGTPPEPTAEATPVE